MKIYYLIPDSFKLNPHMQYENMKLTLEANIILYLHFRISDFFNKNEKIYINKIFIDKNISTIDENRILYMFMNFIYKPSRIISANVQEYLKKRKKFIIIGMHIRTGLYSDFKENAFWFGGINSTDKFIELALNISNYHKNTKWLVCTDSSNISKIITKSYNKYVIDYKKKFKYPSLVRHSREYILKPYNIYASSVLIEIELLSQCNYLFLSAGSMVSRIAYIRNINCNNIKSKCIYISKNSD